MLKRQNYSFISRMVKIIQRSKEVIAIKIQKNGYSGGVGQDRIVFGSREVVSEVASYSLLI